MSRNVLILSFVALLLASCATTQGPLSTAPQMWAGLKPGAYAAGFKSWVVTPPAAEFTHAAAHPIQINVWYPAEAGGTPMTYGDYVALSLSEQSAKEPTDAERAAGLAEFTKYLTLGGVSAEHAKQLIGEPMFARRDAQPLAAKKFPVIYIAQGLLQAASAQAVLGEYLASHGYVVETTPSVARFTGPPPDPEDVGQKSVEQMEDIEKAIAAIHDWPNAAPDRPVALAAYSFGARGALMYAMHHPVSALVSLEGGIGTAAGTMSMFKIGKDVFDLTKELPPIVHFYELNDDRLVPDFRLLHSLRTPDLQLVRMNSMEHAQFTTDGFGAVLFPDIAVMTRAKPGLKSDLQSVAQQTLAFIDKYTKR